MCLYAFIIACKYFILARVFLVSRVMFMIYVILCVLDTLRKVYIGTLLIMQPFIQCADISLRQGCIYIICCATGNMAVFHADEN